MSADTTSQHTQMPRGRHGSFDRSSSVRLRRRVSDLEDQERALEAELSSVLSAVDAGIITLDTAGHVNSQNQTALRILGRRVDRLEAIFGPLGTSRAAIHANASPEMTELVLMEQPDRWLEVSRHAWTSGDTTEVVVIRDVTEARQSRGLREAFLGMLSHELRTPVTTIYAAAALLRPPADSLDAAERAGLVDDIGEEAERLLRLVDDLLVLAHFDEGLDLVQEPSLLQQAVPHVIERERRRRADVEIELAVLSELPVVTGDETSVEQVVRNLVSNAIKYGGGQPIRVELVKGDSPGAIVRVLDRGPGVDPEEAETLFQPFFRSTRTPRATKGAGIGLYVCRRLVEAMGGHVWARGREGGGSEFGFWLPEYAYEPDDGEPASPEPLPDLSRAPRAGSATIPGTDGRERRQLDHPRPPSPTGQLG
jgi:signal transduction histidine kinase